MKRRGHAIRLVTSALQGRLPETSEWPRLLEIAGRGWVTPALYVAFERSGRLDGVPDHVRDYLTLLYDRNLERNRRLRAQLIEALRALNAAGIHPVLLKGAINLFRGDGASSGSRMISDLDINIAPAEIPEAKRALYQLGYRELESSRELARSKDVGVIELHDRPNVRSARYLSGNLAAFAPLVARDGVSARVPNPTAQAIHLIAHDMIKEGDYWRLAINLRHLHDLANLSRSAEGVDWLRVASTFPDRSGNGAVAMQLHALRDLFGIETPSELRGGLLVKLRHALRLRAAADGAAGSLIGLLGRLMWGFHRFSESYAWHGGRDFTIRVRRRLLSPVKGSTV